MATVLYLLLNRVCTMVSISNPQNCKSKRDGIKQHWTHETRLKLFLTDCTGTEPVKVATVSEVSSLCPPYRWHRTLLKCYSMIYFSTCKAAGESPCVLMKTKRQLGSITSWKTVNSYFMNTSYVFAYTRLKHASCCWSNKLHFPIHFQHY